MKKDLAKSKVAVVICTVQLNDCYVKSLKSLAKNTYGSWELIIVDQSNDGRIRKTSEETMRKYNRKIRITYIKDGGHGLSRARNIGWKNSRAQYVCFTDDDAYVDKNWLRMIVDTFEDDESVGIVGGKIIPTYEEVNENWQIPEQWEYILPSFDQGNKVSPYLNGSLPPGVNYSVRRRLLQKFGGFDERLGVNSKRKIQITGEDTYFSLRVLTAGYKIIYNPRVKVYHPVSLARQNLSFLKRRLFSEGVTDIYIKMINRNLGCFFRIRMLMDSLRSIVKLYLNKDSMDRAVYEGTLSRLHGVVYCLTLYGFIR
ncbi:MAG: glycosyltransferase family 2 protein [Patescibacteria group bacterium]